MNHWYKIKISHLNQLIQERIMDKQIRKIEKENKKEGKSLKKLEKMDKKRDKACDIGEKLMHKKKKR